MLFFTPTQWVILALVLVAGWLFGLASHPGGRKWKTRYAAERDANARYRSETDARLTDARKGHDTALAEARARIAELENENARLARAAPVTAQTIAPRDHVDVRPVATTAARPAYAATGERRGWFDWGNRPVR